MKSVIVGGDKRLDALQRQLTRRGDRVHRVDSQSELANNLAALRESDRVIMNYPVLGDGGGFHFQKVMDNVGKDCRVYLCGPGRYTSEENRIVDLWQDEQLVEDNAVLTAEGAIAAAMQAGSRAIRECWCLVIGWGRIGRALTEMLVGLGADVTVASRSTSGRNRAIARGARAMDTADMHIGGFDVIFSTPPVRVLNDVILKKADRNVMILDLASAPFGVDLKSAWAMGLRAWREPGLPGRYCPESAAEVILRAMDRAKGE